MLFCDCDWSQGDTAAALARITDNSAWRDSQMVDSALHWKPPHVLTKYFPGGLSGFDSEDHYSARPSLYSWMISLSLLLSSSLLIIIIIIIIIIICIIIIIIAVSLMASQGSPVWLIPLGLADLQGLLAAVETQQIINFVLRILETSAVILRKTSTPTKLNRHSFVFDLLGLRVTVRLS